MSAFGFNTGYIEELYSQYLEDPQSVSERWREFFSDYHPDDTFQVTPARSRPEIEPSGDGSPVEEAAPPVAPRGDGIPAPAVPRVKQPPIPEGAESVVLRGAPARIVDNMEASLGLPTATSVRYVPVKLMGENRRLINDYQIHVGGFKVSFTHIVAWAIVQAVRAYPSMNASYREVDGKPIHVKPAHVNLGLAIDLEKKDGSRALLVPNIKAAESMNFAQFMGTYNDIVRRARSGALEVADFQDTTITLTNPGMIGTVMSVPRLMPGQGLIVATGAIGYPPEYMALPEAELSRIGLSPVMGLTSTYDHRVIQGAESGMFLSRVSDLLLGKYDFYQQIFLDLHIPQPPFGTADDTSPLLGRADRLSEMEIIRKQAGVIQLIRSYRVRGHLLANIDPLNFETPYHPELDPSTYGLSIWDLDRSWFADGLGGKEMLTLREILQLLWQTYTRTVGTEFMHISDPTEKRWLQDRFEQLDPSADITADVRKRILAKLNAAEAFEQFLHTKYIGHKRFSLEGAETMIPVLDRILTAAADRGVREVVIGMAHRGRLNVLANTLGKPYEAIFSEFEGSIDPSTTQGSGDVKYHLGAKGRHVSEAGNEVKLTLASNPSHLEAVNPVVEGMARAKQRLIWNNEKANSANFQQVIPLLIHGDAAFAGQGVVAETLNLSQLDGYTTGGTIHIVINNQIGFTTAPIHARSSTYATDVARMIQAPVFHVNGDDPEAAVRTAGIALDYRQTYHKDVVIDMVCYRVHGHNEGDEPTFTQPLLYKRIEGHRSVRKLYTETLLRRGVMTPEEAEQMLEDFQERLQDAFEQTKGLDETARPTLREASDRAPKRATAAEPDTSVPEEDLRAVMQALVQLPDDLNVHRKLLRQFERRRSLFDGDRIDWAFGEALAFGSLLMEGTQVRLSGQDSRRGTFSHRHSVLVDQVTEREYVPLNHIRDGQAKLHAYDSLLSEYAVLGFEYGFSVADPDTLVIWEAQFGDFVNGGQIIIDQFLSAAEQKWGERSSLVMLLPHGYEGQGPEHSSARLERFLQSCAQDNLRVVNVSTPANYFHALRRQVQASPHKPLIVMAPKSLLRHPQAVSPVGDFFGGRFSPLLPAEGEPGRVERLLFCSGKVYYDLLASMEESQRSGIAIARLEQIYPFPGDAVRDELDRFGDVDVAWVQEEPRNMGAWSFVAPLFNEQIRSARNTTCGEVRYIGRPVSASTATGSASRHATEQERLIREALHKKP